MRAFSRPLALLIRPVFWRARPDRRGSSSIYCIYANLGAQGQLGAVPMKPDVPHNPPAAAKQSIPTARAPSTFLSESSKKAIWLGSRFKSATTCASISCTGFSNPISCEA